MIRTQSRNSGFTLMELMVSVAIVGILATIAIPGFVGYIQRSKTSEATSNLKMLFTGASAYYNAERTARGPSGTTTTHCTVAAVTATPSTPAGTKARTNFPAASASFEDLGFAIADPHYFSYGMTSTDACGGSANDTTVYTFFFPWRPRRRRGNWPYRSRRGYKRKQ